MNWKTVRLALVVLLSVTVFGNVNWGAEWVERNGVLAENDDKKLLSRPVQSADGTTPNVILIVVDDLGATDLGCYGSVFYDTPNIDRLSQHSVNFSQFYSAHPVCSPTRAALMTGRYPHRVGITNWIPQPSKIHLPHQETTIAEVLQQNGYRTGYIGKWHLGEKPDQLPTGHGFSQQFCVNRAGQPGSYFAPFQRKTGKRSGGRKRGDYWDVPDLENRSEGEYLTDGMTDYALDFIRDPDGRPFFLNLSYYAVHTPIQAPADLVQRYRNKLAISFESPAKPVNEIFKSQSRKRQDNPTYAAMVNRLDHNIGRIVKSLEASGKLDSTIIILTSDNGGLSTLRNRPGPTSVRPFRAGKGWTYEGGIRVPTLISWRSKILPRTTDVLSTSMDLFPTILDLCNLQVEDLSLDGQSVVPALLGKEVGHLNSRPIVWFFPHHHGSGHPPSAALRQGNDKLIYRIETGEVELYDLESDFAERNDLATQELTRVTELTAALKSLLKEQGVKLEQ